MSNPYVGELRLVSFNFAPKGWAVCNGQLLSISQNTPLFDLIGNTYGGDGSSTFALPDLQGRTPIHQGDGYVIGQSGGQASTTLTAEQLPAHTHPLHASSQAGSGGAPAGHLPSSDAGWSAPPKVVKTSSLAIGPTGGGQSVPTLPPYLTLNWIISLTGVFPSPD